MWWTDLCWYVSHTSLLMAMARGLACSAWFGNTAENKQTNKQINIHVHQQKYKLALKYTLNYICTLICYVQ